nr:esterase-like activity of phytase family protein [Xaviernesmea rhizosphaerae]
MKTKTIPTLLLAALAAGVLLFGSDHQDVQAGSSTMETITVSSRPIESFRFGSSTTRFGQLEFLGGLVMRSSHPLFGALSSIRFRPDGQRFLAVMDSGHFVEGRIERDGRGRLSGVSTLKVTPMIDRSGRTGGAKRSMDSEGLAFTPEGVLVSFEGLHRVDLYPDPAVESARPLRTVPILIPRGMLENNRGLETVAAAPADSPLKGAALVVAEESLDGQGNHPAAILDGPLKGRFSVRHRDRYLVTDGAFLPDGDLLLLERRFTVTDGLGFRIRRIDGRTLKPDAVVDGPVLIEANMSEQIDNMEGLDVVTGPDGDTRLFLISDDNRSLLQRSLMLEFRLLP